MPCGNSRSSPAPAYDVVVADETDECGPSLVYNAELPRPVAGTHGLTPAGWGRPVEAWAAAQSQARFKVLAGQLRQPIYLLTSSPAPKRRRPLFVVDQYAKLSARRPIRDRQTRFFGKDGGERMITV